MAQQITLTEAVRAYMAHLQSEGKSSRTLYTYGKDLEQVRRYFGEGRNLLAILKPHVGKFLKSDELLMLTNGQPRAPQTVKKTFRVLRMFFYWAKNEGYIEELPLPKQGPQFENASEE